MAAAARSAGVTVVEAFAAAVRGDGSLPYDVTDAVPQAELIDAAYRAAGLEPRSALSID